MNNIMVTGSSGFDNYNMLSKVLCQFVISLSDIRFLADAERFMVVELVQKYATTYNLCCLNTDYNREKYGSEIEFLIAFWDGKDNGIKKMINHAKRIGIY